jgi:hypothetical protein
LSQGLILLDIPHWIAIWRQKRQETNNEIEKLKKLVDPHHRAVNDEVQQQKFRDKYSFDIAFNISMNQVIYTVVFIYAII